MSEFNAKKARTKHAMPMWVDSFLRKTMTLSVDQIGAYNMILFAMWSRESCDLPNDDAQIAAVCRVTKTIWLRKFKPVLWSFFDVSGDTIFSDRLQKEAVFVEKYLQSQSDKKRGKTRRKPLINNKPDKSGDHSADTTPEDPTQQPNNPTLEVDKSTSTQEAEDYQRYLEAHPKPVESEFGLERFAALLAAGEDPESIIGAAKSYAATVKGWSSEAKVQQSDNFLDPERGKWRDHLSASVAAPVASPEQRLAYWADVINGNGFVAPSSISPSMASALIDRNLVTPSRMKERGIAA